jgi:hypothetical protein
MRQARQARFCHRLRNRPAMKSAVSKAMNSSTNPYWVVVIHLDSQIRISTSLVLLFGAAGKALSPCHTAVCRLDKQESFLPVGFGHLLPLRRNRRPLYQPWRNEPHDCCDERHHTSNESSWSEDTRSGGFGLPLTRAVSKLELPCAPMNVVSVRLPWTSPMKVRKGTISCLLR